MKYRINEKAAAMPIGILAGAFAAVLTTIAGAAGIAQIVLSGKVEENNIGYCIMVLILAASIVGAKLSYALVKHQKTIVCMSTGMAYFLCLGAATALFFGGQYNGAGVTLLIIIGGSTTALLTKTRKGCGMKRGKIKLPKS